MFSLAVSAKVAGTPTLRPPCSGRAIHYGIAGVDALSDRSSGGTSRFAVAKPKSRPSPRPGHGSLQYRGAPQKVGRLGPDPRTEGRGCAWPSRAAALGDQLVAVHLHAALGAPCAQALHIARGLATEMEIAADVDGAQRTPPPKQAL